MSADLLRRAAALMRERAEAQGIRPWSWTGGYPQHVNGVGDASLVAETYNNPDLPYPAAEHIASWHPAVALAVADWLDKYADLYESALHRDRPVFSDHDHALAVARAFLGEADV